ncbi:STAS domain-containing protein [Streptomyces sp. NPDC051133]|uniref:STAS domain-containing protein n=1 Tax=Streptomyces sp. NPDC051133 TaxID=3155521 RepID=UPI003419ECEE
MTNLPPTEFTVAAQCAPPTLTVRITGELDYDTADELVDSVTFHLSRNSALLRAVRLDFAELTWIDSSGLSALLMIHRRTSAIGAVLHLDNRPGFLERMLQITNVLDHLASPTAAPPAQHGEDEGDWTEISAT